MEYVVCCVLAEGERSTWCWAAWLCRGHTTSPILPSTQDTWAASTQGEPFLLVVLIYV